MENFSGIKESKTLILIPNKNDSCVTFPLRKVTHDEVIYPL